LDGAIIRRYVLCQHNSTVGATLQSPFWRSGTGAVVTPPGLYAMTGYASVSLEPATLR